jgi:hypothetical protein
MGERKVHNRNLKAVLVILQVSFPPVLLSIICFFRVSMVLCIFPSGILVVISRKEKVE